MAISNVFVVLTQGYMPSILLVILAVGLLCLQKLSVQMDPREPPLLKPKVPYIGHILGMIQHSTSYFDILSARHKLPIYTLPMINAKTYVITSPTMSQTAFRSKDLSFEPFMVEFAQRMLGVSDEVMVPMKKPATEKEPHILREFVKVIHESLMGDSLHKTNINALDAIAVSINGMDRSFAPDSLFLWLRNTLTLATSDALFGSKNPLKIDPSLVDSLWDFDAQVIQLIVEIFPSYFVPKAYRGRAAIQAALTEYYKNGHYLEPDVSSLVRVRAACFEKYGIVPKDIGQLELALLHVATANAIPTTFWALLFIVSNPSLTKLIREELLSITTTKTSKDENEKREIKIDISKFSTHCPLLVSCYRETIRLANSNIGARRVMTDTTISDGKSTYLLKAGCDVQIPSGVSHMSPENWGATASQFDPRRFLDPSMKGGATPEEKDSDRQQKRAYFPFGGGRHLCPGRNFAFAEILGMISVLVLGFEVKDKEEGLVKVPEMGRSGVAEGVVKPTGEGLKLGVRIERRGGWEDVVWAFSC